MKTICDEWTLHNKLRASMLIESSVGANYLVTRFYLIRSVRFTLD